jgi:threonine dehydrogenase-like Zn-dependent dehydrogenase
MCLWGRFTERGIGGLHGYCAERYAERPEYLFPIDDSLEPVAVLLEPLTVSEKGLRHLWSAQRRMTVWEPKRALVTGAGPVGILAAVVLRLRGLEVTVVERTFKPARGELLARIGAAYVATNDTPLASLGPVDVVLEATGSSAVAFAAIELLGPNGAIVLTSVTGGGRRMELPADDLNQRIVLRNLLVLGSVNANAADFRQGIADLALAEKRYPGFFASLITRRVPLADAARALQHDPTHIKTVVEIQGQGPLRSEATASGATDQ